MEWNKQNTLQFIKLISERPVIWDVALMNHKNKDKRIDALSEIAEILGITKEEVNSKWISLKGQYTREKKKEESQVYNSKWFAYQEMANLVTYAPQESTPVDYNSISPVNVSAPLQTVPAPVFFFESITTEPLTRLTTSPSPPPPKQPPPPTAPTSPPRARKLHRLKRKRNSALYKEALLTLRGIKQRLSQAAESHDEITTYGLYIAAQMRKISPVLQSKLKLEIQTLLCKYEMEHLETSSSVSSMSNNKH